MKRTADEVLALLNEHGARLHALLLRLTLRYDVAEDLMQELFCKLVDCEPFAAATNPLAYAIRMATNLAFDHRRLQRRSERGAITAESLSALAPSTDPSPLADLVRREELDQVLDAIGQLPEGSREMVVLRYLERQDCETIARQFGKTPHQVRALCHKAITRLRVLLDVERPARSVPRRPTS